MSTDLPIANNNDNTPETPSTSNETNMYGQGLPLPCAPPALSRPHETPSMANEDNNATLDPTTPTDFTLTSRQQRVLNYLARRRMRSARITKRQTYADLLETQHNNDKPVPDPLTPAPTTPESSANQHEAPFLLPEEDEQLSIEVLAESTQPLYGTPIPEMFIVPADNDLTSLGIFGETTQPLKETPIAISAPAAPLAGA